jgi:DNA-binding NtrC family response regulator
MTDRILVVDDDQDIRNLMTLLLNEKGYEVKTAVNGNDALHRLEETKFDLVIADLNMPVMNGASLYMFATIWHPELKYKFLFMSGTLPEDVCINKEQLNFISKPFTVTELLEKIEAIK